MMTCETLESLESAPFDPDLDVQQMALQDTANGLVYLLFSLLFFVSK